MCYHRIDQFSHISHIWLHNIAHYLCGYCVELVAGQFENKGKLIELFWGPNGALTGVLPFRPLSCEGHSKLSTQ